MTTETRPCEVCGEGYGRRPTETARQFAARRFCSRTCSGKRPRAPGRRNARPPELVRCAECEGLFEAIPSRIERTRSGRLYCSIECQAEDRHRGEVMSRPVGEIRRAIAEDARTGHYTLAELAARFGRPESTIGVMLHREGVSLRTARLNANSKEVCP